MAKEEKVEYAGFKWYRASRQKSTETKNSPSNDGKKSKNSEYF